MPELERRSSISVTPWLVGVVLLVAVAAVVIAVVPLANCPICDGSGTVEVVVAIRDTVTASAPIKCDRCGKEGESPFAFGTGKVSVFNRWTRRNTEQAR
jgi:hypothetical protein